MKDQKNQKNKKDKNVIEKLSDFAFVMSVISVCTIGICPAFAVMGIVVPAVLKSKNAPMSDFVISKNKKSVILGVIALFMFVIDIGLVCLAHAKLGWF